MANENDKTHMEDSFLIFVEGEVSTESPVVERRDITGYGEAPIGERKIIRLRTASGCNHVLHTAESVGGRCVCGSLLCSMCSSELCALCGKCVCGSCRRYISLRGEEEMVCIGCEEKETIKSLKTFGAVVGLIAVVVLIGFLIYLFVGR